ncbi:hypothetical protein BGZ63DRAFT_409261 [Mariannaea sp. PMI_226]|nr:hypothetical protein BGZ63DRAFT_409261 [Mariannaea sp. PMI_226]
MATDEQRPLCGERRRRRILSLLAYLSCSLHLAALVCIILLATAGTTYTAYNSQGPASFAHAGEETLLYREFALLQFTTNISGSTPTLYWFLDAFGWEYFYGSQDSAGLAYLATGQTLYFPDTMSTFLNAFNSTVGFDIWENCTYHNVTQHDSSRYTCVPDYDNRTIAGFGAAPSLSVTTAPAFAFYVLVMVLTILVLPIDLARRARDERRASVVGRHTLLATLERYLLAVYAVVPGAHLIAAACVTGAAVRVANYLRNTPELAGLAWGVSLGSGFLELVWLGFLATLLGSIVRALRWCLKQRWK